MKQVTVMSLFVYYTDGQLTKSTPPSNLNMVPADPSNWCNHICKLLIDQKIVTPPRKEGSQGPKQVANPIIAGYTLILPSLPEHYLLYKRKRANGSTDYYLYGHGSGKPFDRPAYFVPHVKYLLGLSGGQCTCKLC